MAKYIKCKPNIEYEIVIDNKTIYRGNDEALLKGFIEALLEAKKHDFYVYEHKRRRYMLLDDEEYQELKEKRNTKDD